MANEQTRDVCGFIPPTRGYAPCRRLKGHDGPCAHELEHEGFCTHCSEQIKSFEGLTRCPKCGTTSQPCTYEEQLSLSINVHELRILCIWAESWSRRFTGKDEESKDVVYAIAHRIRKQLPETLAKVPLTMRDEFAALKESFPTFQTNHPAADNPETGENYRPDRAA